MRKIFINHLVKAAIKNKKIVLVVGDLGYGIVEPFKKKFPNRFFNAGVAEQSMAGIAAGLALKGFHVFIYSIANFPTFRCAEQIRNDIDYHNLPVTVVSVGGGLAYGNLGYSHHGVQDFSLVRSMPNMLIAAPGDPYETSACMSYLFDNPQPSYLRINKAGEPNINKQLPKTLVGKLNLIHSRPNNQNLILTTGSILNHAHDIYISNKEVHDKWSLGTLPLWGEKSRAEVYKSLCSYKNIVVIEEHLQSGGLSSSLMENGLNIKSLHLSSEVCGEVGDQTFLINNFGLSRENILSLLLKYD